jgi:hypothetical protein
MEMSGKPTMSSSGGLVPCNWLKIACIDKSKSNGERTCRRPTGEGRHSLVRKIVQDIL